MGRTAFFMTVTSALALAIVAGSARADALVDEAKSVVEKATARADKWDGPTSGPKAVAKKTIVYVAGDMRNGGILGVAHGLKEASDVLGWTYREIDGQGTVSGQAAALSQAIALKPDAIVVGGSDAVQQNAGLEDAAKQEIAIVGWHAGPKPGPMEGAPVFANVTTDAMEVAKVAAMKAIANSNGKAGVVVFANSAYAIAIAKGRAMESLDQEVRGLQGAGFRGYAARRHEQIASQLTTTLLQQFGPKWTHSLAINDLYYNSMGPSLQVAGLKGDGDPQNISAGDGSESAYQRIRDKDYQSATVPEPLNMQGWQLRRRTQSRLRSREWSGFVPGVHLVTAANVAFDGGPKNVFDPDNGYRDEYKKIWGIK